MRINIITCIMLISKRAQPAWDRDLDAHACTHGSECSGGFPSVSQSACSVKISMSTARVQDQQKACASVITRVIFFYPSYLHNIGKATISLCACALLQSHSVLSISFHSLSLECCSLFFSFEYGPEHAGARGLAAAALSAEICCD